MKTVTSLTIIIKHISIIDLQTSIKVKSQLNIKTRYDYNLTIMKSPKPATDNRFKK